MDDALMTQIEAFERCVKARDHVAAERILQDGYVLALVQPAPAEMPRQRWLDVLDDYLAPPLHAAVGGPHARGLRGQASSCFTSVFGATLR